MKTDIKQRLSKYLGNTEKRDPKDKDYKKKRAEAYRQWYPKFQALKQEAELKNLTVLEYFEQYIDKPSKKKKPSIPIPEPEEEEYPCPNCTKIYTTEASLKRHITMKHPEDFE